MAFAKHFTNNPDELVRSALRSIPRLNADLRLDEDNKIIYRAVDPEAREDARKVKIVSGGGAGHEPSFVSYVGRGMLNAAISGSIFASPSPSQIYNAIRFRLGKENAPVLLIGMNYTGDVLNFGLGAEKARAAGLDVRMVIVGDDVGVGRERSGKVGRRGIAGTVLVHKITGALAESGGDIEQCELLANIVSKNLVSIGASLAHVHVPGHEANINDGLGLNEIEVGMGIHNEQGSARMEVPSLPNLIKLLLDQLLNKDNKDRAYLDWSQDANFVLLVNNLGGVSPLELGGITAEVLAQLGETYGIRPLRVFSGTFMTSLNGLGFSVTLLKLVDFSGFSILELLDAPAKVCAWPNNLPSLPGPDELEFKPGAGVAEELDLEVPSGLRIDVDRFGTILTRGLQKLKAAEKDITKYDQEVGDGDCGIGLRKGADAVLELIKSGNVTEDAVVTVMRIANVVEKSMDGTSGAIYCIFTNALAISLRDEDRSSQNPTPVDTGIWSTAANNAFIALKNYTPAEPGDRTLVDALAPFVRTLYEMKDMKAAAQAARKGAESTRGMKPKLGRTVYVGDIGQVPDPGAIGVAELVEGLAEALR